MRTKNWFIFVYKFLLSKINLFGVKSRYMPAFNLRGSSEIVNLFRINQTIQGTER